jgi:hypothetical protein
MPPPDRYLGTVHVRFTRPGAGGLLFDHDLDALADALIGIRDVVTVRVEPAGAPAVYRIDVQTRTLERAAALATTPVDAVCEWLGLVGEVISITVVKSQAGPC